MSGKSVNINHYDTTILTSDGSYLSLNKNGAVKVGNGINVEESTINNSKQATLIDYKGAIRYNKDTNKLEYCNGTTWLEFVTEEEDNRIPMVYSMLF